MHAGVLEESTAATRNDNRIVGEGVRLTIGNVGAAEDHGVVEHVTGAFRNVLERNEQIGKAGQAINGITA